MKKIYSLAIALTLFATNAMADGGDLLSQFPHKETFKLQGGETVEMPFLVQDCNFTILMGTADSAKLNAELAGQDVVVDEVAPGVGLVSLYLISYNKADPGPYNEVIATINVKQNVAGLPATKGYFVWNIKVTSDLALRVGREVWGFPKTLADISLSTVGQSLVDKSPDFEATCTDCSTLPSGQMRNDFNFVTPYEIRRTWAAASNEGQFATRAYDASKDKFSPSVASILGNKLAAVGFTPSQWVTAHDVEAVLSK